MRDQAPPVTSTPCSDDTSLIDDFRHPHRHQFARVCAATVPVTLGAPTTNAQRIIHAIRAAHDHGASVVVFPELAVTGYSAGDLFTSTVLMNSVDEALRCIIEATAEIHPLVIVGTPLRAGNSLYNCAVAISKGEVIGITAKQAIPNYREFEESRWFSSPMDSYSFDLQTSIGGHHFPIYPSMIYQCEDLPGLAVSAEICEDMWVPRPPSMVAAMSGASVIVNLSSSPVTVGRSRDRHLMVRSASVRGICAYAYTSAGPGESTNDLAWDGEAMIYEMGDLLAHNTRYFPDMQLTYADVDLDRIMSRRREMNTFPTDAQEFSVCSASFRLSSSPQTNRELIRHIERYPFVPSDRQHRAEDCAETYAIQVSALTQRLRSIGSARPVIGVSGGLDSTQALLVCAKAMDDLDRPRSDILAYTLPGFATTEHTRSNAQDLCEHLGVTFKQVDIRPMAQQMLADLDHPFARGEEVYDVTFENVQAGVRTDFLFRAANANGGFVIGTGDMSELALGWCTYGVGDHMSHYGVNAGVPKTLMQHLIRWIIDDAHFGADVNATLQSILDTEITPELIPTRNGEEPQSTEASIGPYGLHDFTLYYTLRGYTPTKIAYLAWQAWSREHSHDTHPDGPFYELPDILKWMRVFYRRFFSQQFKRSAIPNGPRVSAGGSLSPRGDWRMPSDASSRVWVDAVTEIAHELGINLDEE